LITPPTAQAQTRSIVPADSNVLRTAVDISPAIAKAGSIVLASLVCRTTRFWPISGHAVELETATGSVFVAYRCVTEPIGATAGISAAIATAPSIWLTERPGSAANFLVPATAIRFRLAARSILLANGDKAFGRISTAIVVLSAIAYPLHAGAIGNAHGAGRTTRILVRAARAIVFGLAAGTVLQADSAVASPRIRTAVVAFPAIARRHAAKLRVAGNGETIALRAFGNVAASLCRNAPESRATSLEFAAAFLGDLAILTKTAGPIGQARPASATNFAAI